jgi:crossover junction endodeoxyribonuclease RuvC
MDLHHVTLTGPLELYRQGWQHEDELGRPGTAHQATGARATGDTCLMVFGIDPGLTGAIAVLAPDGTLQALWDTPTLTLKTSRGTRQEYDLPGLVGLLVRYTGSQTHVLIEEAQAMPGQGTRSMFTIGLGMGIWLGILGALGLAHTRVRPAVWKRRLGLTSDKEQARLRAQQLYPGADLRRKRDHGRAEALLLAWHGRQTYQERMP